MLCTLPLQPALQPLIQLTQLLGLLRQLTPHEFIAAPCLLGLLGQLQLGLPRFFSLLRQLTLDLPCFFGLLRLLFQASLQRAA